MDALLPHPDRVVVTAERLRALAAALGGGAPHYRSAPPAAGGFAARVAETGGGDHVVLWWRGDQVLLKAFDHEAPGSRHARDDGEPDPALVVGAPAWVLELLEEPVLGHEGADRTACAWSEDGETWEVRVDPAGEPPGHPLFLVAPNLEEAATWLADLAGRPVDREVLRAVLAGERELDAATVVALAPPLRGGNPPWLEGRGRLDPFVATVVATGDGATDLGTIKAIRLVTGEGLAAIKQTLGKGGVLYECELHRHDHHRRVPAIRRLLAELGAGGQLCVRALGEPAPERWATRAVDAASFEFLASAG